MQPRYKLLIPPVLILVLLCLYVFGSQSAATTEIPATRPADAACLQDQTNCPASPGTDNEDLMLENLSRQFISISPVN